MQFTLKHLRYFTAAAEHSSVTAAARAIHVSQPSISGPSPISGTSSTCSCSFAITPRAIADAGRPSPALEARSLLAHADDLGKAPAARRTRWPAT